MDSLRKCILTASYQSKACHIGSALSTAEIVKAIYQAKRKKDVFIHSKASGIVTWYCHQYGTNKATELLKKYPLPSRETGLPFSSGSLGHGLSYAAGVAYANRKIKVYCLLSDGELQEGQVWEAALFAYQHQLNNLICVVDNNRIQALDFTYEVLNIENLEAKFKAFNWEAIRVDGHNVTELINVFKKKSTKPLCVIAETTKGKGVSFMENSVDWHYKNLDKHGLKKALLELNAQTGKERQEYYCDRW